MSDLAVLIGLPLLGSLVAAAGALVLMRRLRGRSLRSQVLAAGLATTMTTVAGVFVTSAAMFISDHDLVVLAAVLVLSGSVSVGCALWLGGGFQRSVAVVAGMARRLTDGSNVTVSSDQASLLVTSELQALAAELVAASGQLAGSREREQALDASRRELVAWVSHDLRSPIASIRAMAEALEDGVVGDADGVARYHRAIRQESERLGDLVEDLFELSRITSGTLDPGQPLVPLADVLADVLDGAGPVAAARGVELVALLDRAPDILAPASDLRRVLHNLLDNAIRHTPHGGRVVLDGFACPPADASGQALQEVALTVVDECGGIPERDLPRVFDVAFRGDVARTRDLVGGGLGLAIARGLVESHDGTIDVVNSATGCRFTVRMPMGGTP